MIDKLITVLLIMTLTAFLVTRPDDYQSPTEMWAGQITLEPGPQLVSDAPEAPAAEDTVVVPAEESPYPIDLPAADLPGVSFVVTATVPNVKVTATPGGDDVIHEFANPVASGGPLVFIVEEFDGLDNFRVLLPTRPNGSFGWVSADEVYLARHNYSIRVELSEFKLTVFEREQPIFETTVGVARGNTPTPLGRYYTTELLQPPTDDSPYGSYAYGLSGYSDTFTEFSGGPGQLGIHGTNDPGSIGTNASAGCVRLTNKDIETMVNIIVLPLGVPVEIIA